MNTYRIPSNKSPPWVKNFKYRIGYLIPHALVLWILYTCDASILYKGDRVHNYARYTSKETDDSVETFLWFILGCTIISYFMVQSSTPGYLDPQRFPVTDNDPESLSSTNSNSNHDDSTNDRTALNSPTSTRASLSASGTGLEQIHYTEGIRDSLHTPSHVSSSVSSSSHPLPSLSSISSSSSSSSSSYRRNNRSLSPSSVPYPPQHQDDQETNYHRNDTDNDRHSLLGVATTGTNDGYNPETASDPVGMALDAIKNAENGYRPCRWCSVAQPPRAHHCKECDKCVALFDHHCNVINTCIGERNRFRFWLFLGLESSSIATAIGILNTAFVWRRNMGDWIGTNALPLITLIILWLTQLYVLGLFVFHTWLAFTNTTTYETTVGVKKLWYLAGTEPKDCDLPFSKGTCYNLRLFCCTLDRCCSRSGWQSICSRKESTVKSTNSSNDNTNNPSRTPSTISLSQPKNETYEEEGWRPHEWERAKKIDRESTDICRNIWENRYYSCC